MNGNPPSVEDGADSQEASTLKHGRRLSQWDPEVVAGYKNVFNKIDSDQDEKITVEQLATYQRQGTIDDEDVFVEFGGADKLKDFIESHDAEDETEIGFGEFLKAATGTDVEDAGNKIYRPWDIEELDKYKAQFMAIDADGDGVITMTELLDIRQEEAARRMEDFDREAESEAVYKFFKRADISNDLELSFPEFLLAMTGRYDPPPPTYQLPPTKHDTKEWVEKKAQVFTPEEEEIRARLRIIFDSIDADANGYIDLEEMLNMQHEISLQRDANWDEEATREAMRKFHKEADENNDSVMDFEEFVKAMQQHVMLTNEELQANSDAALWRKIQQRTHLDFTNSTIEDIKDMIPSLRHQIIELTENTSGDFEREQFQKRTARLLQVSLSLNEHLVTVYDRYEGLKQEHLEATRSARTAQRSLAESKKQLRFMSEDHEAQIKELKEDALNEKEMLQNQLEIARADFARRVEEIEESRDRQVADLEKTLDAQTTAFDELTADFDALTAEHEIEKQNLTKSASQNEEMTARHSELEKENQELREKIKGLENQSSSLKQQFEGTLTKLNEVESEKEQFVLHCDDRHCSKPQCAVM